MARRGSEVLETMVVLAMTIAITFSVMGILVGGLLQTSTNVNQRVQTILAPLTQASA